MKKTNKAGFTLVEIMIVVAIIGLLAAIGIPSFQKARANSIEKSKQNNARILASAVEQWAMDNAKEGTATVATSNVVDYIKGGFSSLSVGDSTIAGLPTAGSTVDWYTNTVSTIADAMYPAE